MLSRGVNSDRRYNELLTQHEALILNTLREIGWRNRFLNDFGYDAIKLNELLRLFNCVTDFIYLYSFAWSVNSGTACVGSSLPQYNISDYDPAIYVPLIMQASGYVAAVHSAGAPLGGEYTTYLDFVTGDFVDKFIGDGFIVGRLVNASGAGLSTYLTLWRNAMGIVT